MPDGSSRNLTGISTGENYFFEFCFRILVWLYLVKNGIIKKGFMVLDNLDAHIDLEHIKKMKEILIKTKDQISYIITTSKPELLDATFNKIDLIVDQRSILDYINISKDWNF